MKRKQPSVVIGGMPRGLPDIRFRRYRTARALVVAFFKPMGRMRDLEGSGGMLKAVEELDVWAFASRNERVVRYWARPDANPLHVAYVLGHEVGHLSGRPYKSRRKDWAEEMRADEYGAAAFLALREAGHG